jgi:hypothetical protein
MKNLVILSIAAMSLNLSAKTVECVDYRNEVRKIVMEISDTKKEMKYIDGDIRDLSKLLFTVENQEVLVVENILVSVESLEKGKIELHLISPKTASILESGFEIFGSYSAGYIADNGSSRQVIIGKLDDDQELLDYTKILNIDLARQHASHLGIMFGDVKCSVK